MTDRSKPKNILSQCFASKSLQQFLEEASRQMEEAWRPLREMFGEPGPPPPVPAPDPNLYINCGRETPEPEAVEPAALVETSAAPNEIVPEPPQAPQPPAPSVEPPPAKKRMSASITSEIAARRLEYYLQTSPISKTEFATAAGTSDRTLRKFRNTGRVRLDILKNIAEAMGKTVEELVKPE
ncbi:MAG: helix-turn-helix domain-containing protein [Bryobacteraceae bacterium]|nr:helix-turn-helix domain-containing protein [Bryobacteraceae bacterium]